MRRVLPALLVALLIGGCAAKTPPPAPPPSPAAVEPSPQPKPAQRFEVPISFHVRIDGQTVEPSPPFGLASDAPVEVMVTFTDAVDRASAEQALSRRLPAGTAFAWSDDQTVTITVPEGGQFEVDASGAKAATGTRTVVSSPRSVYRPPLTHVELYRVSDLLAGTGTPAYRHRVPWATSAVKMAPDGKTAFYYANDPFMPGVAPTLVDLTTGKETRLPVPVDTYSLGGWLPDGRLFLVGGGVFVGDGAGRELKVISKEASGWVSTLSPTGSHLAVWRHGADGRITLVDMQSGESRQVEGPFRRGVQDGAVNLGWSPDGKLLAGSDHDADTGVGGRGARIRIIDPFSARQERTIEGLTFSKWLPSGEMLAWKPGDLGGSYFSLQLNPDGSASGVAAPHGYPSPDGRFWISERQESQGSPVRYYLVERATGREVPLQDYPRWASADYIYTIARQQ